MSFRRIRIQKPAAVPAFAALLCILLAAAGCGSSKTAGGAAYQAPVTYRPLDGSVGKVVDVRERLRFVVLDYTLNRIPSPGTRLVLYRSTNIIGALKLTGWTTGYTAAADILEGTPEVGDEARLE